MGLWHKLASNSSSAPPQAGIASAALRGASLDELCQEAYRALHPVLRGRVDRFGVWLARESGFRALLASELFHCRFWADGRELASGDFSMTDSHPPFPVALLAGGPPLEQDLQKDPISS